MIRAIIFAAALGAGGLHASEAAKFAGTWVMRLGDRNLFVLTLAEDGGSLHGSFEHPSKLSSTNGLFANIGGAIVRDNISSVHISDAALHLTVQNPSNANDRDNYIMTVHDRHAELRPADLPPGVAVAPWQFEPASPGARVATDWEPNRVYGPGDSDTPSAEMTAIFNSDQKDRTAGNVDWNIVGKADAQRREQTRKLLASRALHTGEDYEHAAFVFQHGESADDYLLAHTLAMIAVSKGRPTATWIAAATLDRYLQKSGQKQIFGTQFLRDPQHGWTQEPYDRTLISDSLREQLGVPAQALQARQLEAYQAQK